MSGKRFILLGIILMICHLGVALGSLLVSFGASIDQFEGGIRGKSAFESFAGHVCDIMWQPGASLWRLWMSKALPNAFEWPVALLNSALWGFGFAFLIRLLPKRRKDSQIPSPSKSPSS